MHHGACTLNEVDLNTRIRVFRDLPVGMIVWQLRNPKDVRSLHFMGFNPAAERQLHASLAFAMGKPIAECFPGLLHTRVPEIYRSVALTGTPRTLGELPYKDARVPDGVFWIECFPLSGLCVGVAIENITDRKRLVESQTRALYLLHRITVMLNESSSVLEAAQFCLNEICRQIAWPVGRLFLIDETSATRFLPNPVWYFSDPHRFRAFQKATELHERDLTNRLALEYRTLQGRKAGLTRSTGFKIVENDLLRGVLELSSESATPLDEHFIRAISNIGIQLGRVFERERAARDHQTLKRKLEACKVSRQHPSPGWASLHIDRVLADSMEQLRRSCEENRARAAGLAQSVQFLRRTVTSARQITTRPLRFRSASSDAPAPTAPLPSFKPA